MIITLLTGIYSSDKWITDGYFLFFSIAAQPGLDQPSILLRDDTRRSYLLGGLRPNVKYRVQVRAQTSVGLSTRPAISELTTNQTLGKHRSDAKSTFISYVMMYFLSAPSKPTFFVTQRGSNFFNVSFDPTIMAVPGSVYYVQYKENINGKCSYWYHVK